MDLLALYFSSCFHPHGRLHQKTVMTYVVADDILQEDSTMMTWRDSKPVAGVRVDVRKFGRMAFSATDLELKDVLDGANGIADHLSVTQRKSVDAILNRIHSRELRYTNVLHSYYCAVPWIIVVVNDLYSAGGSYQWYMLLLISNEDTIAKIICIVKAETYQDSDYYKSVPISGRMLSFAGRLDPTFGFPVLRLIRHSPGSWKDVSLWRNRGEHCGHHLPRLRSFQILMTVAQRPFALAALQNCFPKCIPKDITCIVFDYGWSIIQ